MPARPRLLAAVLATTALGLGALAVPAQAAPVPQSTRGIAVPSFYTPPATLPATNGALIRTEPLKLGLNLPGINKPMPGSATRIMYRSTDANGAPVAVTGSYLEPSAAWKGKGPRPLVVLAPGTMGQGDQCSLSFALQTPVAFGGQGTVTIGYEILAIYRLLQKGVAVAQTDYLGLGTPDRTHTYVGRLDEGHATLDAARAARRLAGTSLTPLSPVGLYGYSQGGGAVASAAELQPTYAPDVPLIATSAGAAPADLNAVTQAIDGSELVGAVGWAINGFVSENPSLQGLLDRTVSAAGKAVLKDLSTMCVGDAIGRYIYTKSSAWTTDGKTISQVAAREPAMKAVLDAQRIGRSTPAGVVRVSTGISDNLVPHAQARQLAVDWCGRGGKVTYVPIDTPNVGSPLLNHFGPLLVDQGSAIDWLTGTLGGRASTSNCATMNRLR